MRTVRPHTSLLDYQDALLSVRETLNVLGGKWKIPIIISLGFGDKRFVEIKHDISGITSKVLAHELNALMMYKLITKRTSADDSADVYALTEKCLSLEKVIEGLKNWGDYHRSSIFNRAITTSRIPGFSQAHCQKEK